MRRQKVIYLVIQEGGSSAEHYPTLYDTKRDADRAVSSHHKASYRSTAPIPVPARLDADRVAWIREEDLIDVVTAAREAEYR
jgi:hypothetical protein